MSWVAFYLIGVAIAFIMLTSFAPYSKEEFKSKTNYVVAILAMSSSSWLYVLAMIFITLNDGE